MFLHLIEKEKEMVIYKDSYKRNRKKKEYNKIYYHTYISISSILEILDKDTL